MSDQNYLVTARKYRPSLFKEVVAQGHVTETLKNAIELDRLAHAYLFSGPRGVGKTTAARILAKAINCETPRSEREDGAEPCCECDSCVSFEEGRSLNVFEMDAASNNKVDDVRELREKVRIPPQGEQKKVYILDEVHMLSKQAFNALLKTLEEPPAHALFIFATTEPHKVLPTILSRCQRFDFRRIPVPRIVERLREICETEGVEADEESLMLLARKGNGALRDALSAFDQALSLCGTTLEYGELAQALGVVDQDLYFELTEHVATQDTAGVLTLVRHVVRSGYDLQEFLAGLAEHLRNLLVAHSLGGDALDGVAESTRRRYAEEADRFGEADLLRLLTVAGDAEDDVKNSPQPRLKLETTLLKMAQMRRAADLRTVLRKIDRLEQMAEEGQIPASLSGEAPDVEAPDAEAPAPDDGASTAAEPTPSYEADPADAAAPTPDPPGERPDPPAATGDNETKDDGTEDRETENEEDAPASSPAPAPSPKAAETDDPTDQADDPSDQEAATDDEADREDEDDAPDDDSPPSSASDSTVEYDDLFGRPALEGGGSSDDDAPTDATGPSSADASGGTGAQAAVAEPTVEPATPDVEGLAEQWPQFVQAVKAERISIGSLLGETEPVELTGDTLTVAVPKSLHRDSLRDQRRFLVDRLAGTFEADIGEVRFVVEASSTETTDGTADAAPLSPREQLEALRDTYPALEVLFGEFEAEPVW
ncbi:MAG: DNA polymerase III subunit gamma/tau [Salinivenus sp.]